MKKAMFSDATVTIKLVFSVLIILFFWFIFQILAIITGMFFFKLNLEGALQILNNFNGTSGINFLKYVQGVTSTGLFIISPFIIAYFLDENPFNFLYLKKNPDFKNIVLIFFLIILIQPFSNLLAELNEKLQLPDYLQNVQLLLENKESYMEKIMERFLTSSNEWSLFVNIVIIALIPAIGEELVFRGVLQRLFISMFKNAHVGIIITAFIFSAVHLQFLSFLPRFVLGIILGYLVLWSGSLFLAMIAHFINNTLAVIYYHFHYAGKIGNDLEVIGSPEHGLIYGILSIILTAGILTIIYLNSKKTRLI